MPKKAPAKLTSGSKSGSRCSQPKLQRIFMHLGETMMLEGLLLNEFTEKLWMKYVTIADYEA
jgi:hypothetical protein